MIVSTYSTFPNCNKIEKLSFQIAIKTEKRASSSAIFSDFHIFLNLNYKNIMKFINIIDL